MEGSTSASMKLKEYLVEVEAEAGTTIATTNGRNNGLPRSLTSVSRISFN
jgi:hypothetical protein